MKRANSVKALAKEVRQSPRKVSLVASLVRGRTVADALVILNHTPKRAAKAVAKTIKSAQANALQQGYAENSLVIDRLQITAGPRLKRYNPAAHGRALPYLKRSSHILVTVAGQVKPKKPAPNTDKKETK